MGKRSKTRIMIDEINKVEGFNPSELAIQIENQLHIPVKDRISWFKLLCPDGSIIPGEPKFLPELNAWNVHVEIFDENQRLISAGNGTASYHEADEFGKHPIECAETKAIGRALATAGFGNQFSGSDFVQNEPIDMGVPVETTENEGNLFDEPKEEPKKNEGDKDKFEKKVEKLMKTYTPEMSKGIVLSYGPYPNITIAEVYKTAPADKRLGVLEQYAFPAEPDMEHAGQIAACRIFLEALKNAKK